MESNREKVLEKLAKSKFRSSFSLSKKLQDYVKEKGIEVIERHARDFIKLRLAPYPTFHDGKQTPMKGHPVFVAQHATATCCRNCLLKWHHIAKDRPLTEKEQEWIVSLIMAWILKNTMEIK